MIRDAIYRCFPFLRCSPLLWPSFSFNPLQCDERGIRHENRVWDLPSVSGSQGELGESQKVTNLGGGGREGLEYGRSRPRPPCLQPPTGFSPLSCFLWTGDSSLFVTYLQMDGNCQNYRPSLFFLGGVHRSEGHGILTVEIWWLVVSTFSPDNLRLKWENGIRDLGGYSSHYVNPMIDCSHICITLFIKERYI